MDETLAIAKALGDESRLRILMMVRERETCVCQIVEVLGLAASTVSKHLFLLKSAGLIESRKQGRWVYYRRPKHLSQRVAGALHWLDQALADSDVVVADRKHGMVVCSQEPQDVARRQRQEAK